MPKKKKTELLPDILPEDAAPFEETALEVVPAAELDIPEEVIQEALASDERLAEVLNEQFEEGSRQLRRTYWRIGTILCRVQDSMSDQPERVTERVRKAARTLNRAERLLWDAAKFAREFPDRETVERLAIDWTAVRAVLSVPDSTKRAQIMASPEIGEMTVSQVKAKVKEAIQELEENSPGIRETEPPKKKKTKKDEVNLFADPIAVFDKVKEAVTQVTDDLAKAQCQLDSDICELTQLMTCLPGVIAKACDEKYPDEWFGQVVDIGTAIWKELQTLSALTVKTPPNERIAVLAERLDAELSGNFVDIQDVKAAWRKGEDKV